MPERNLTLPEEEAVGPFEEGRAVAEVLEDWAAGWPMVGPVTCWGMRESVDRT
jgi:hypothetical protein